MAIVKSEKRVTLHDVANAAGVTHTTVSLALREHSRISQRTRDRVNEVVKQLNYRPNNTARRLAGGKNNTIVVLASFFSSYFELEFLRGIQEGMGCTGYNLSQYSTMASSSKKDELFEQIIYENLAEGVIALNLKPSEEALAIYQRRGIPIILIEEEMEGTIVIRTDNHAGAYNATSHLIKRGYKNIALLSGSMTCEEAGSSPMDRYEGYCEALTEHNMEINYDYIYETEDFGIDDGCRSFDQIQKEHPEIDAVFCSAGDFVAFGIMRCAKQKGIRIPEDIALIGYDDHFAGELTSPALSTMRQPIFDMGNTALKTLVKAMTYSLHDVNPYTLFNSELIIRETC